MPDYDLIAILGPTASGKTPFAAALAYELFQRMICQTVTQFRIFRYGHQFISFQHGFQIHTCPST